MTVIEYNFAVAVDRSIDSLHPKMRKPVSGLAEHLKRAYEAGRMKTRFELFETFRHPLRQLALRTKGVSKAGPWESLHQFGLAADFVPRNERGWTWEIEISEWDELDRAAKLYGLVRPISWDRPHIEHPRADWLIERLR